MKCCAPGARYALRRFGAVAALCTAVAGCLDPDEPGNLVAETVVDDPSIPHIEVNGTQLHSETFGDPTHPMVMTLHGGPGGDYRGILPLQALADDGYYVVFWDQRGSGLSERHDADTYSFNLFLEDLLAVIDHYSSAPDQPVVFIGHSWGAMYATWFINEYGDYGGRIRGAVLSEPGAFTYQDLEDYMADLIGSLELAGESVNDATWSTQFLSGVGHERADYLSAIRAWGGTPAEHLDPDNLAPFWRSGAVVNARLFELAEEEGFDWTTNLDAYTSQVLFLRGELNEAMPLAHQEKLAAHYPSAEVVTIPDVGHEMIWERPVEYLDHVRTYFQEIGFEGGTL
jgi:proline iminopeptidase